MKHGNYYQRPVDFSGFDDAGTLASDSGHKLCLERKLDILVFFKKKKNTRCERREDRTKFMSNDCTYVMAFPESMCSRGILRH